MIMCGEGQGKISDRLQGSREIGQLGEYREYICISDMSNKEGWAS